jgi:GT2 family glycosyltransferase
MTSAKPKVSIIMVDGLFRERFESIDFFARQNLAPHDYELIWVEYYDHVHPDLAQRIAQYPNFRTICLNRTGTYHSSYCFNRGITEARGDLIMIPDADVIVENDFVQNAWADHQATDNLVQYFHRYNEDQHNHREPIDIDHLRRVCRITNPANHGGCLSVRRHWLTKINGYEQHPIFATGFHANDLDVYNRLKSLGLLVRWSPTARMYHPWHPSTAAYADNYIPQQKTIEYRACHLLSLPFQGIDPSLNTEPPQELLRFAQWWHNRQQPLSTRVLRKVRQHLRRAA